MFWGHTLLWNNNNNNRKNKNIVIEKMFSGGQEAGFLTIGLIAVDLTRLISHYLPDKAVWQVSL